MYKSSFQFFKPRLYWLCLRYCCQNCWLRFRTKVMGLESRVPLEMLVSILCFWCLFGAFYLQKHIHCTSHKPQKSFDITNFLHGAWKKSCGISAVVPFFFCNFLYWCMKAGLSFLVALPHFLFSPNIICFFDWVLNKSKNGKTFPICPFSGYTN